MGVSFKAENETSRVVKSDGQDFQNTCEEVKKLEVSRPNQFCYSGCLVCVCDGLVEFQLTTKI